MIYDYKNRKVRFESPAEEKAYNRHMDDFGPGTGKSHPDDCEYCAKRGWKTFADKSWDEMCDEWAAAHPEEFEEEEPKA